MESVEGQEKKPIELTVPVTAFILNKVVTWCEKHKGRLYDIRSA